MSGQRLFLVVAICLSTALMARADPLIASAQQRLKEQGFYHGEVDGKENFDTVAAIRRYQIRNGLKVSGELNSETQRALGIGSDRVPTSVEKRTGSPSGDPAASRDGSSASQPDEVVSPTRASPAPTSATIPHDLPRQTNGVLDGTPYEISAPDVQREVITGAQIVLARGGYYRSDIDGVYGPGTELALRAYQARVGLVVTGRLDLETLAVMGMLPTRHQLRPRSRRFPWQRSEPIYQGEMVPE